MEIVAKLCAAGPVAQVARVGHAPLDGDDALEITFQSGALFHIDIGLEHATNLTIGEGPLLEKAYGHLRTEAPDTFAAIARDWSSAPLELPWLMGAALTRPRRLFMTEPYSAEVGFVFDANGREFALFGESDWIWANALDDPELEGFGLEIGPAV